MIIESQLYTTATVTTVTDLHYENSFCAEWNLYTFIYIYIGIQKSIEKVARLYFKWRTQQRDTEKFPRFFQNIAIF